MRPNIVIIMADQQRADLRKSRGYALDTMPFLDSLGRQGTDFDLAYTPCPQCLPARVSLFTGRYAQSHHARTNHNAENTVCETDMLEWLKASGYRTALCGKNHTHYVESDFDFAETCGHLGHEGNMPLISGQDKALADFLDETNHMEAHIPAPGGVEAQHPYRNVSAALSFIDSVKENPFFVWVSFAEPHNPFQVPEPYFDMFPPDDLPKISTTPADGAAKGNKYSWTRNIWERIMQNDIDRRILRARSNYHGMLRLIDDQVKRLYQGIENRGIMDNTFIIYVSDHGDFAGEYGLIRKGADLSESLVRIPMIWCGNSVERQGINKTDCVSLVDIFPTLCDIMGESIPFGVQGKSLLPLLQNKDIPHEEYNCAYVENGFGGLYWSDDDSLTLFEEGTCKEGIEPGSLLTFDCLNTWTQCGQVRMLRCGKFKIQLDMLGNGYLYDLAKDPYETDNLYENREHTGTKSDMLAKLMAASLRASDPIPVPNHRYRYKQHPKGYWFDKNYIAK